MEFKNKLKCIFSGHDWIIILLTGIMKCKRCGKIGNMHSYSIYKQGFKDGLHESLFQSREDTARMFDDADNYLKSKKLA